MPTESFTEGGPAPALSLQSICSSLMEELNGPDGFVGSYLRNDTLPDTLPSVSWTPEPVSSAFHFPWSLKAFSLVPPNQCGALGEAYRLLVVV